jgi:hypothetical protein
MQGMTKNIPGPFAPPTKDSKNLKLNRMKQIHNLWKKVDTPRYHINR